MRRKMVAWCVGLGLAIAPTGCAEGGNAEGSAPTGEAPAAAAAPAAPSSRAEGTPIPGCGGELRLLPGDRVEAGGRTLDCGDLDQLLVTQVIDHTCLGALAQHGGRSCIERFVAESRGRSRILQRRAAPAALAAPEGEATP